MADNNVLQALAKGPLADAPVSSGVAISAIALQMAMQYHDMGMIKDGTLYQQYKIEGKDIRTIDMSDIFETAIQIEKHLMGGSDRIADIVVDALQAGAHEEKTIKEYVDAILSGELKLSQENEGKYKSLFSTAKEVSTNDEEAAVAMLLQFFDDRGMDVTFVESYLDTRDDLDKITQLLLDDLTEENQYTDECTLKCAQAWNILDKIVSGELFLSDHPKFTKEKKDLFDKLIAEARSDDNKVMVEILDDYLVSQGIVSVDSRSYINNYPQKDKVIQIALDDLKGWNEIELN